MAQPRFYLPLSSEVLDRALETGEPLELTAEAAHHAGRALRLKNGERVTLFNGEGLEWGGIISFSKASSAVTIDTRAAVERECPLEIILLQALVAPEKTDWIVEKAVELGVSELILVPSERSVTRLTDERAQKRLQKLESLIISASEQCGRNRLMRIRFIPVLKEAFAQTEADLKLILAPGAAPAEYTGSSAKRIAVAVGAEGGFSEAEIALAAESGWLPKLLGARVMRTETAGLAAAVWLNTLYGDFR